MTAADHGRGEIGPVRGAAPDHPIVGPLAPELAGDLLAGDHVADCAARLRAACFARLRAVQAVQANRRAGYDEGVAVANTGMPDDSGSLTVPSR